MGVVIISYKSEQTAAEWRGSAACAAPVLGLGNTTFPQRGNESWNKGSRLARMAHATGKGRRIPGSDDERSSAEAGRSAVKAYAATPKGRGFGGTLAAGRNRGGGLSLFRASSAFFPGLGWSWRAKSAKMAPRSRQDGAKRA